MPTVASIFIAAVLVAFVAAVNETTKDEFKEWKIRNHKNYNGKSFRNESLARSNFLANFAAFKKHNRKRNVTFKQGLNAFADLTPQEIIKTRTGYREPSSVKEDRGPSIERKKTESDRPKRSSQPLPAEVDYTDLMSQPRDQGSCGSCWAFSTVATLEYWARKKGLDLMLSEQNLVDCVPKSRNCGGCSGGDPGGALKQIVDFGIADGTQYTYRGVVFPCQNESFPSAFKLPNMAQKNLGGDEETMKLLLNRYGPVIVTIQVLDDLCYYKSGVYFNSMCGANANNHAVVLVGYGTDPDYGDYWKIRNSWGPTWGIGGYALFARNKGNMCGLCNNAWIPLMVCSMEKLANCVIQLITTLIPSIRGSQVNDAVMRKALDLLGKEMHESRQIRNELEQMKRDNVELRKMVSWMWVVTLCLIGYIAKLLKQLENDF